MSCDLTAPLSVTSAIIVGMGAMVGAGLFIVTGVTAGMAGPLILVGLFVAGLVALLNGFSVVQLSLHAPDGVGTYTFASRLLSPAWGFTAGWLYLVSKIAAATVVALGFGAYFHALLSFIPTQIGAVLGMAMALLATRANIRKAGWVNTSIVVLTLIGLSGFVVRGIPYMQPGTLSVMAPFGWSPLWEASALLFFAFTGFARVPMLGTSVDQPYFALPRILILSTGVTLLVYLLVTTVTLGVMGYEWFGESASPLQEAAQVIGPRGRALMVLAALFALMGVLLSQLQTIGRITYAMGRQGDLPDVFARQDPEKGVPYVGLYAAAPLFLILIVANTLMSALYVAVCTILLYYVVTHIATFRLPVESRQYPALIAGLGLLLCVFLVLALPLTVTIEVLVFVGLGWVIRWATRLYLAAHA